MVDSSFNSTYAYNSTLEGSVVLVWCDGFVVTAFCHRNGSWSPQLTDSVCDIMTTGEKIQYWRHLYSLAPSKKLMS